MAYVGFGIGLLALASLTAGVARWAGLGLGVEPLWVLLRATVQLAVVAVLLQGVLAAPWTVVGFVVLMLSAASWTAAGRVRDLPRARRTAVAGVLAGSASSLGAIYVLRLAEPDARSLVAVAGIVVGATMTAATLSGRNFARARRERRGEIEAMFALGASPSLAHEEIGREAAHESLLATLDQSRSTGLVTLPGAFVGALFGGASPVEAAQFQLVVLGGIALAMTVTAVVVTRLAGLAPYAPPDAAT